MASIIENVNRTLATLKWDVVVNMISGRIQRLAEIDECPIIYIGSAGSKPSSENTLKGRYREFSGRHTVMYPVWALLYFGWELDYGWLTRDDAGAAELELKHEYKKLHQGVLPALVSR